MKMALSACGLALAALAAPAQALTLNAPWPVETLQSPVPSNGLSNATVLIVRHAEKTGYSTGLSAAGGVRAEAYASYFSDFSISNHAVHIDSLVAAMDTTGSYRPRLTLEPLSAKMGMKIAQPCDEAAVSELVDWMRQQPGDRTTLIAWHHTKIGKLMRAFGADPAAFLPKGHWPEDVFDWVVVLRFDGQGKLIPDETKIIREPAAINNRVWQAMAHPTVSSLASYEQTLQNPPLPDGTALLAER